MFRGFIVCIITGIAGIAAATYFQKQSCGAAFHLGSEQTRGIFWNNLRYWYPAAVAGFFNISLIGVQFEKLFSFKYTDTVNLISWINLLAYGFLLVCGIEYLRSRIVKKNAEVNIFILFGFILCVAIAGGLAFLSFTTAPQVFVGGNKWTFINEGRYFAFVTVFVQLWFFVHFYAIRIVFDKKKLIHILMVFLFASMLINSIHEMYFATKVAFRFRDMKSSVTKEQDYVYFEDYLRQMVRERPAQDILVVAGDMYFPLLASMYGAKGIGNPYEINSVLPKVKVQSTLIVVISELERDRFAEYLKKNEYNLVKQVADKSVYIQDLNP